MIHSNKCKLLDRFINDIIYFCSFKVLTAMIHLNLLKIKQFIRKKLLNQVKFLKLVLQNIVRYY